MIQIVLDGYSRDVLLVGNWAIKIPSLRNGWKAFLLGIMGNMKESEIWETSKHPRLAKPYIIIPGGWLNLYPRYDVLKRSLSSNEVSALPIYGYDPKLGNYGVDMKGNVIVLDYGHCDCWPKFTAEELEL